MRLAVAVPMKPLARAKARLRPGLGDAARQELAVNMLTHVLAAIAASRVAEACGVVSADPAALALAASWGCEAIQEPAPRGYNAAAARASAWAQARRCDALLILPSDLPHLTPGDLQALAQRAADCTPALVIAPDTSRTGTNALLLRPPHLMPTHFGPSSFLRHLEQAHLIGVQPIIYDSPTLARDIDWPQDLATLPPGTLNA